MTYIFKYAIPKASRIWSLCSQTLIKSCPKLDLFLTLLIITYLAQEDFVLNLYNSPCVRAYGVFPSSLSPKKTLNIKFN